MNQLSPAQIRMLRQSRGMGQKDAAAKMNITPQRYAQLESHKKDLPNETLLRILKALGYTMASAIKYLDAIPPHARVATTKK